MGISGLLSLLKSIQKPCSLRKFNGLTLGVDAYVWLHRGAVPCAIDLALGNPTAKFVDFAMNRVRMLIHFGITPYLVFDGDYLPSKAVTEVDRAERREKSRAFGLQLYRAGKSSQAQAELQKAVDITPEMAAQLIEELRRHNIKYTVAPYEADAQLVYLERKGYIQGIITEDSDLLVFGAQRLLTKLDQYGECIEIERNQFTACKDISLVGWTDSEFRRMAILSGCDYLPSVNGLGLKTAYSLVRKFNSNERIIQRLRFDAKYNVPADYLENFRRAELTFQHQWVYCPNSQKLVMGTPLSNCEFENLDFLGNDLDPTIARGVATGRLHPTTKKPLVPKRVPLRNTQSPWRAAGNAQIATPTTKIGKPIDQYFKSGRVPLAELDPNSFTPSPSQRILQATPARAWLPSPAPSRSLPQQRTRARPPITCSTPDHDGSSNSHGGASKRPRLCDDTHETSEKMVSKDATSRFFTQIPSTSRSKSSYSRSIKRESLVDIWSDESIDDALAQLPDVADSTDIGLCIHRDENASEDTSPVTLNVNNSTVSSKSSSTQTSTVTSTQTSLTTSTNMSRASQPKTDGHVEKVATPSASRLNARADLTQFTTAQVDGADFVPESPQLNKKAAIIHDHSAEEKEFVNRTPRCQRGIVGGSEDLLVPQSDDESAPNSPCPQSPMAASLKLDLAQFYFKQR